MSLDKHNSDSSHLLHVISNSMFVDNNPMVGINRSINQ